ncbi:MAG: hypothetical protein WA993_17340 [Candidatus Binatus sp.]|jgi:hypothetical protein|uniref:hypothetical protein n=1 Tax=Candidatus Binatus sp. TaxID=2811406 RepID=UPI003C9A11B7
MKIPKQIDALHRAVSATSGEELQSACSWLLSVRAINREDAHEAFSALNTFRDFFNKIERRPDSN